jgi:hypothetical protein
MHTECLIAFLSLKPIVLSAQTGIKANAEFIVFYVKRKN